MNWEAIGEVCGAIAVVVTLIYLAGQLRQNTNALRSASYQHWNEITSSGNRDKNGPVVIAQSAQSGDYSRTELPANAFVESQAF